MEKYKTFEVFDEPKSPKEYGKPVGHTPIYDQAVKACQIASEQGKHYGIAGITEDGRRIVFL